MRLLGGKESSSELISLLEQSGENIKRSAATLHELLTDFPERKDLTRELLLCEQEGDRIAHNIVRYLGTAKSNRKALGNSTDIYALTTALDDIVDYAEETGDCLVLYGVEAPMEQALRLSEVLVEAANRVADALSSLRGPEEELKRQLVEIHRLENEGDRLVREAIASLFAGGIDPMVVIRWKDIFESLENAVDACETVAHILERIAVQ